MIDSEHYTYRVVWSAEDDEHVGLCAEFPSLSFLAAKPAKALTGIMETIDEVVQDMMQHDEEVPEPMGSKDYSGKFMVRIPPDQHRNLAIQAAEMGLSLNRLVSSKLV